MAYIDDINGLSLKDLEIYLEEALGGNEFNNYMELVYPGDCNIIEQDGMNFVDIKGNHVIYGKVNNNIIEHNDIVVRANNYNTLVSKINKIEQGINLNLLLRAASENNTYRIIDDSMKPAEAIAMYLDIFGDFNTDSTFSLMDQSIYSKIIRDKKIINTKWVKWNSNLSYLDNDQKNLIFFVNRKCGYMDRCNFTIKNDNGYELRYKMWQIVDIKKVGVISLEEI